MSNFLRNIVRSNAVKALTMPQTMGIRSGAGSRSLWHMSKSMSPMTMNIKCTGMAGCNCGCGRRFASTNGEKALVDFLQEEIASEKETLAGHLPSQLDGFAIKFDNAEVELVKQSGSEKIVIKFNVNHTVDADPNELDADENEQKQSDKAPVLQSKPNFEIDIVKNGTTLSLTCMYLLDAPAEGEYEDVFGIQEITIFKGEHAGEKVYACAGDVLDGYFYDLLMNLLAEKGVTDEFASKISELATQYEQKLFVNLLEETKKFFESK